jgi:transposase
MTRLFWLSDEAWAAIDPHLPRGKPGKPRVDDRRVISGILHVLKTGCRWRDVPAEYGPATTIYNRYNRWSQRGLWQRLFEQIAASGDVPHELSLDSSHVKAHRSAAGAKRMARPVGKWLLQLAQTVCTNVSGLSAMPLAKMEIRAFYSS